MFGYGCEFCHTVREQDIFDKAEPFIAKARSIIFAHAFRKTDLTLVQAMLLLSHYLQGTLELNECWNLVGLMVRSAISIGTHLNPTEDTSLTSIEREIRKRVWWGCYILDRTLSMKFGRPPSLQTDAALAVDFPLDVDDEYITASSLVPRQPSSWASRTSFFIETIKLAFVIDRILADLYLNNRKSHSSKPSDPPLIVGTKESTILGNTVHLDGNLQAWFNSMPSYLRKAPEYPDGISFHRQRAVVRIRYINMRILLQRAPFLHFSRYRIEDNYLRAVAIASAKTCLAAARDAIQLIDELYTNSMLNSLWYNLHYVFTAIGVLLYLRTMDKERLEMINELGEEAMFERGIGFLRMASRSSKLAARYLSMLEQILQSTHSRSRRVDLTLETSLSELDAIPRIEPLDIDNGASQFHDFSTPNFTDSLDLMFGMGLPNDLLPTDWPNYGP